MEPTFIVNKKFVIGKDDYTCTSIEDEKVQFYVIRDFVEDLLPRFIDFSMESTCKKRLIEITHEKEGDDFLLFERAKPLIAKMTKRNVMGFLGTSLCIRITYYHVCCLVADISFFFCARNIMMGEEQIHELQWSHENLSNAEALVVTASEIGKVPALKEMKAYGKSYMKKDRYALRKAITNFIKNMLQPEFKELLNQLENDDVYHGYLNFFIDKHPIWMTPEVRITSRQFFV
ncbi:hypothetical protein RIF29_10946 [Crotalaria pallida]|uniref:Uncharacterized protein n=1 Tax=Crotalaria pallida TaxID=3830 RepID=A0AAN9FWJ6_CROPI